MLSADLVRLCQWGKSLSYTPDTSSDHHHLFSGHCNYSALVSLLARILLSSTPDHITHLAKCL